MLLNIRTICYSLGTFVIVFTI